MNALRRKLAPISSAAWEEIDAEAKRILKVKLAARKLVDFVGPLGLHAASVNLGRADSLKAGPVPGVGASLRRSLPLVELTTAFDLSRGELDDIDRGCKNPDLEPLANAATRIAYAEDSAVFHGYAAGGIRGISECSTHEPLPISQAYEAYPQTVAEATGLLRIAGVDGPYAIALGHRCYTGLMQATERGGFSVLDLVRRLIDGPVVWAPAVDGAMVVSLRGGDFELTVGQDLSVGYLSHNDRSVRLYVMESLTFRVLTPEAAVPLTYKNAGTAERSAPGRRRGGGTRRQARRAVRVVG